MEQNAHSFGEACVLAPSSEPGTPSSVKVASLHLAVRPPLKGPDRGRGWKRRKKREEGKGKMVFSASTQASKETPKEERRRVPSCDESIQEHPNKKGKKRKEKREREKKRKRTAVPSCAQASRDTLVREG